MKNQKKVALVLGSGGVRGVSYLGILDVLTAAGIQFDSIVGCSIGAWYGAHYAVHQDIDLLYDITINKRKEIRNAFLEPSWGKGLIKGKKLEKQLSEWLGTNKTIESILAPQLAIVSTDLVSGHMHVHRTGSIASAVYASMAIPTLLKPVITTEKIFVDGGLSNPVPVDVARAMGADIVIALVLDGSNPELRIFSAEKIGMKGILNRSINVLQYHAGKQIIADADVIIQPNIADSRFLSWRKYFTQGNATEYINLGKKAAHEALPEIKKLLE